MIRPVCLFAALFATTFAAAQPSTEIRIDAGQPASYTVPRTIFGTFLEPIGASLYGGLWAQILENPSFEDAQWSASNLESKLRAEPPLVGGSELGLPLPWEPLHSRQGWRYEPRWGEAVNSFRSLLVMGMPGQETGVRQGVYLPVSRTSRYLGSIYAKAVSGPREIHVSLRRRNRPEEIFRSQTITLQGDAWQRYEFTLDLPARSLAPTEEADFVLTVQEDGRVLFDQAELYPADHIDGMNPEMIALAKALRSPVLRYGGNFTSGYHWRDGVGPRDKRVTMLNQSWGMPEYNTFGTDELLRFCDLIGSAPQIALNLGSGTPQEAAEWVRYVNGRWGNHRGGLLWELGNELWGNWQIGYPTLAELSPRTQAFSRAVREVDPQAQLIATGQDPDVFEKWNAAQLAAPDAFQYLSTHFVVTIPSVRKAQPTPEFIAASGLALPVELERRLRQMKAQIDADPRARGHVRLAFTEWLFYGRDNRSPSFTNLGGALCTAGFLNMLLRTADFVPIADMTGLIEFGGIWQKKGRVFATPAYYAFRLYSTADIDRLVRTDVKGETYDVHEGNIRLPEIAAVPYLDIVSTLNKTGSTLTVLCVNRDFQRDLPADLNFAGFAPGATVHIRQLTAGSLYDRNDETDPDAVVPEESTRPVSGTRLHYTFPRASVTVMELSKK